MINLENREQLKKSWKECDKRYDSKIPFNDINRLCAGKRILSYEEINEYLYHKLKADEPFWIGRFGNTEILTMDYFIQKELFPLSRDRRKEYTKKMCNGPGFFPCKKEEVERFVQLMLSDLNEIDILAQWNQYMEEWYIENYMSNVIITGLGAFEPWGNDLFDKDTIHPWTLGLEGKKVLVIHPFEDTIQEQYRKNRENIFKNLPIEDFLPQFELKTIKAVQSIGGTETEYGDWFEALESMVEKCKKNEFDVAIIGCGAYGFPLAAEIKRMGKTAIHMGGATQLLFGIRGNRWDIFARDDMESIYAKMINSYWVRPNEKEKVANMGMVEDACYW